MESRDTGHVTAAQRAAAEAQSRKLVHIVKLNSGEYGVHLGQRTYHHGSEEAAVCDREWWVEFLTDAIADAYRAGLARGKEREQWLEEGRNMAERDFIKLIAAACSDNWSIKDIQPLVKTFYDMARRAGLMMGSQRLNERAGQLEIMAHPDTHGIRATCAGELRLLAAELDRLASEGKP